MSSLAQCIANPIIIRPLETIGYYPHPGWSSNKFDPDPWREQDTIRVLIRSFELDLRGGAIGYCIAFNPILFNLELSLVFCRSVSKNENKLIEKRSGRVLVVDRSIEGMDGGLRSQHGTFCQRLSKTSQCQSRTHGMDLS